MFHNFKSFVLFSMLLSSVSIMYKDPDYYMNNIYDFCNKIGLEERNILNDEEIIQYLYA